MNNGGSTLLLIAGIGVAVILLFLLLGNPEPQAVTEPVTAAASESVTQAVGTTRTASNPVVHAGPDQTVGERETVRLSGEGYDPTGLAVTFRWTASHGLGFFENAQSPTTRYTAPSACDCDDTVTLTLTATNAMGISVSDQMVLSVRDPIACPASTCESSGYFYVAPVDACRDAGSEGPCPITPALPCDSPCITDVPADPGCAVAPVPCPCADDSDCSGIWSTGWPFDEQPVHPKDRATPSIDRHFPGEVNEGQTVALKGYIRNPSCQTVCYTWSVSKGWLENAHTLTPTYHAPQSDRLDGETVTINLTVYDTSQGRSYDQIRIKIRNKVPR